MEHADSFMSYGKKAIKINKPKNIREVVVVAENFFLSDFKGLKFYDDITLAEEVLVEAKKNYDCAEILPLQVVTNMPKDEQKEIDNSPNEKVFKIETIDDFGGSKTLFIRSTKKEIRVWLLNHYKKHHRADFDTEQKGFLDIVSFYPCAKYITICGDENDSPLALGNSISIEEFFFKENTTPFEGDVVFSVSHVDSWFEEVLQTFTNADEAVEFLKAHMQSKKHLFDLLDDECLEDEEITTGQGEVIFYSGDGENTSNTYCAASWFYSAKASYEYDEWETAAYTCVVKKHNVLKLEPEASSLFAVKTANGLEIL